MKLKIFTVYDQAAGAYINPFFLPKNEQAIREFTNACNDQGHQFCRNPKDYTLFYLGEFEVETGKIKTEATPIAIIKALEAQTQLSMFKEEQHEISDESQLRAGTVG